MSVQDKLHQMKKKLFLGGLITLGVLTGIHAKNNSVESSTPTKKEIKAKLEEMGVEGKFLSRLSKDLANNWEAMSARDSQKGDSMVVKNVGVEELEWGDEYNKYFDLKFGEILDKIPIKDTNKDFTADYASKNDYYMDTAHKLGLNKDAKLLSLDENNQGIKGKYVVVEASNGLAILSDDGKTAVAGVVKDYKMNYFWVQPDNVVAPCDGHSDYMFPVDLAATLIGERDYDPVNMGTRKTNYVFYAAQRAVKEKMQTKQNNDVSNNIMSQVKQNIKN